MSRRRIHPDGSPAARMRRSRAGFSARGGRLVQFVLDADASRALAAGELVEPELSRSEVAGRAFAALASEHRFPTRLGRDEETALARLANGPFALEAFRKTGYSDRFLAGLALALATDRRLPRASLVALARALDRGMVTLDNYRRWIEASPIGLARLFKLVDHALAVARVRTTT